MLERLAYYLNRRVPALFAPVRLISGRLARLVHGKSNAYIIQQAKNAIKDAEARSKFKLPIRMKRKGGTLNVKQ